VPTPPEAATAAALCWSCSGRIDKADRYCRHCGAGQGEAIPWYYKPLGLAFLALFALGPFVLPMVWKSPRLDKNAKLGATALVALFTLWLCAKFYQLMQMFGSAMSGLGSLQLQ
jgi:hypothetical protein